MKNRAASGIMLTLLLVSMLTLAFNIQPAKAEPTTITVPDDYPTIQEAINNANEGDTIYVKAGTYYEHIFIYKNNLTLLGEDKDTTIIDASGAGTVIYVTGDNTIVTGFAILKGGGVWPYSGIFLYHSFNSYVYNNKATNNSHYGIYLRDCSSVSVYNNDAINNYDGITLYGSSNISVYNNNVTNNSMGVFLQKSSNIAFYNNTVNRNSYSGIVLIPASNVSIYNNNIINSEYGMWIKESSDNAIYHNNFINNTQQVYDRSWDLPVSPSINTWDDGYPSGGNYWSDYAGVDSNQDGIGDTPYVIDENNQDKYPLMSPWRERTVGVKVGDWAKYNVDTSWMGVLDPRLEMWSETEWAMMEVTDVQGTVVTFTGTSHFKNGSELTAHGGKWDIAPTGSFGFIFFFIGSNLQAGDRVYPSGVMTINETVTGTYCGVPREINHLNWSTSFSITPGPPYDLNEFDCYWDQATGILTEESLEASTEDLSNRFSLHVKMVDTNLWEAPIPTTIDDLRIKIEELGSEGEIDNQGIVKSLVAKLNVAQKLVDKGKIDEAKSILEDDFIPQVQNLSGIHITLETADILIQSVEYIMYHL